MNNNILGLAEEMYSDEFTSIANVDISSVVIKQQQERNKERQTLSWEVMDVSKKLAFPDETFHVVIDKGTLDSILCGESSTNNVTNSIFEIIRVLKPDGKFVMISHGIPDKWLGYLEQTQYSWKVSCFALARPSLSHLSTPESAATASKSENGNGKGLSSAASLGPIAIAGGGGPFYPSNIHFMYVCEKQASDFGVLKE
jgi:ubiquinone/menaquinone biosynthesis C-methylase UbiE